MVEVLANKLQPPFILKFQMNQYIGELNIPFLRNLITRFDGETFSDAFSPLLSSKSRLLLSA